LHCGISIWAGPGPPAALTSDSLISERFDTFEILDYTAVSS
jgi:hypothetical protein